MLSHFELDFVQMYPTGKFAESQGDMIIELIWKYYPNTKTRKPKALVNHLVSVSFDHYHYVECDCGSILKNESVVRLLIDLLFPSKVRLLWTEYSYLNHALYRVLVWVRGQHREGSLDCRERLLGRQGAKEVVTVFVCECTIVDVMNRSSIDLYTVYIISNYIWSSEYITRRYQGVATLLLLCYVSTLFIH